MCKDPQEQAKAEAKLRAEDEARQMNDLRRAVGFRRVVDEIFKAGIPVVCHNGLLVRLFLAVVAAAVCLFSSRLRRSVVESAATVVGTGLSQLCAGQP